MLSNKSDSAFALIINRCSHPVRAIPCNLNCNSIECTFTHLTTSQMTNNVDWVDDQLHWCHPSPWLHDCSIWKSKQIEFDWNQLKWCAVNLSQQPSNEVRQVGHTWSGWHNNNPSPNRLLHLGLCLLWGCLLLLLLRLLLSHVHFNKGNLGVRIDMSGPKIT